MDAKRKLDQEPLTAKLSSNSGSFNTKSSRSLQDEAELFRQLQQEAEILEKQARECPVPKPTGWIGRVLGFEGQQQHSQIEEQSTKP